MRSPSRPFRSALAAILLAFAGPVAAEVELVMLDGRALRGVDVRREGGDYVLVDATGVTSTFPAELVREVRIVSVGGAPIEGLRVVAEPQVLAGPREPIEPPTPTEQLGVFGEPARFQRGPIDSTWVPDNDWPGTDPRYDEEHKSTWAKGPIDPDWKPTSAWEGQGDKLEPSRSAWKPSIVNSDWQPTDGFSR